MRCPFQYIRHRLTIPIHSSLFPVVRPPKPTNLALKGVDTIKRLIIISFILITLIFLTIYSIFYLKDITGQTLTALTQATTKADIEEILSFWDKEKKKVGLFIHDERVNEITDHIENCYALVDHPNFEAEIEKTRLSIQELYQKELPTFYNIF